MKVHAAGRARRILTTPWALVWLFPEDRDPRLLRLTMDGYFDGTLGSDPVHQDRPHHGLDLSTLGCCPNSEVGLSE